MNTFGVDVPRTGLFEGLNSGLEHELFQTARQFLFAAGSHLFQQGEPSDDLFFLHRGWTKLYQVTRDGSQIISCFSGAGDVLGCLELVENRHEEHLLSALAVTDCAVLAWKSQDFSALMREHAVLSFNAFNCLKRSLKTLLVQYRELATERVEQRLAQALLRLIQQTGVPSKGGLAVPFPLSRQDLAELTGSSLYTISRILSDWEQKGLLGGGRQRLILFDLEGISSFALAPQAPS